MSFLLPGEVIIDANKNRFVVHSYVGDGYMAYREGDVNETLVFFPEELL